MVVGAPGIGKSRLVDEGRVRGHEPGPSRALGPLLGHGWGASPIGRGFKHCGLTCEAPMPTNSDLSWEPVPPTWPRCCRSWVRCSLTCRHRPSLIQSRPAFGYSTRSPHLLLNASRAEGLVLVIDDLHAADPASILLLLFVSKQVREGPLPVIATYRDVELTPDHPLSGALPDLAREPSTVFFELLGLGEDSTRSLVVESAGFDPRPARGRALHRSTGGNPCSSARRSRMLLAEGLLSADSGSESFSKTVVPARVHEVIARRLTHVSDPTRDLLVVAAVIGPEFSTDAMRVVLNATEDEVLDRLDEAVDAGLLTTVPGASGRFLIRARPRRDFYAALTPAVRLRLHRQIAEGLESSLRRRPGHALS